MKLIGQYQEELNQACIHFRVNELYAFGSILTEKFNDSSDIDLLVSIDSTDPVEYAERYFDLKFELERIFNRKIDLVEEKAIKNEIFKAKLNHTKTLVYTRKNQGLAR